MGSFCDTFVSFLKSLMLVDSLFTANNTDIFNTDIFLNSQFEKERRPLEQHQGG